MGRGLEYTDRDRMHFGKWKGFCLRDVPKDYLLWVYEKTLLIGKEGDALKRYIEDKILKNNGKR